MQTNLFYKGKESGTGSPCGEPVPGSRVCRLRVLGQERLQLAVDLGDVVVDAGGLQLGDGLGILGVEIHIAVEDRGQLLVSLLKFNFSKTVADTSLLDAGLLFGV